MARTWKGCALSSCKIMGRYLPSETVGSLRGLPIWSSLCGGYSYFWLWPGLCCRIEPTPGSRLLCRMGDLCLFLEGPMELVMKNCLGFCQLYFQHRVRIRNKIFFYLSVLIP